jgi:hypothetical protein
LDIPEKARLEKLLGMLGSSFDGERANAARLISGMAEKAEAHCRRADLRRSRAGASGASAAEAKARAGEG